jgi:FixJ family two-component response regulator
VADTAGNLLLEAAALAGYHAIMTRSSGPQMLREMREAGWHPRVLFTSGYTARDMGERATLDPSLPFLPKPWTVTDLLRKIRDVLDAPPAG